MSTPEGLKSREPERVYAPKPIRKVRRSAYFRNPYVVKRRGPSVRELLLFLLLLVILLLADGVYVVLKIQAPLRESSRLLMLGADALQEGEVDAARAAFTDATERAEAAESLSARPSLFLASHTPWFSNDADAIRTLARSARLFATAGSEGADAIEVLGGTSRSEIAEALYSGGRLQFDTIQDAQRALTSVADGLAEARRLLESAPYPRIDRLAAALETARDQVIEVEPRAAAAARLLEVVPRMMGRDEPREYFVALQNQSEARATGGLIGLYGIMEADRGQIRLTHVGSSSELSIGIKKPLDTGILLPSWYAARYGDEVDFGSVNRSPQFPIVARTIVQMYRNATGTQLDGVWSFDPLAFEDVTRATGPLRGPGFDVSIGPENAARIVLEDSYEHFGLDYEGQTRFLLGIIQDLYDKLGSGQADTAALFEALTAAAQGNNFKIYSTTADEQDTLESLGIDGGLETDGFPRQLVFHNNLEGNKVDTFMHRTVDSRIDLTAQGGADITTTIELDNQAPSGPPSIQLGFPQRGERTGYNDMELNVVLPRNAANITATLDGEATGVEIGLEGVLPVAYLNVGVPPQSSREVIISYSVQKVQSFRENGRDFRFVLVPQPTAIADTYRVELTAPKSYGLVRRVGDRKRPSGKLVYEGQLEVPVTIRASVVRR